ncbi:GlxA family transcriptional regulator [Negadavirga shengliensis]|uniref:GlxA family transcriptional regulator n=1 Tax=Negadavirga shengliensis TaxID=1389218 RepID=A0ABV9SWH5_9BACT
MIRTVIVFLKGGTPTTAVTPVEILSSAGFLYEQLKGLKGKRFFDVRTASLDGQKVQTLTPLQLEPDHSIDEIDAADLLVISGGGGGLKDICRQNEKLIPLLRRLYEQGTAIAGICSGVPLLAESGLLDGRPATTHWAIVDDCRKRYPQVDWQPERYVTESGNIFCSGGVYSGVDLCLYIVEKYCGHQTAMHTAKALLLRTPRIWQAGYTAEAPKIHHEDEQIRSVQEWIFKNFRESVDVTVLALSAHMSPRTFARRFKAATGETPINYLQRVRINAARHLIENDLKSVLEISRSVGYEDLAFFNRLFKRYTGLSPSVYRERFSVDSPKKMAAGKHAHHH